MSITHTYSASGAIAPTDALAVVSSASAVAMTLAAGSVDGFLVRVKRLGVGAVTLAATIDGAAQTLTMNAAGPPWEAYSLRWSASLNSYIVE